MKASFMKRAMAYIFDYAILSIIFFIITMGITNDNSNIQNKLNDVLDKYTNEEITIEEYTDEVISLNYELQQKNLVMNGITLAIYVGYFAIFAYLNNGQTIGKKMAKIRVVKNDGEKASIWNMLVRNIFIYEMISLLYSVIGVNIMKPDIFTYGYMSLVYLEAIFVVITFFMVLYRKDGRGLHDIIAKTKVIEEA